MEESVLDDADFAYVSATELARRVRDREVSPTELVDACAARIEERNPSLNAFVFTDVDGARGAAREAERALADGSEIGPLHGVPTAIKDLFDFKPGWPATFGGVRALADFSLDAYCIFAERVERAGAIIVGKTNSPVMGFRGTCDNPLFGATANPFDTSRNPGGSSGGSAAAVADGLVPFAEGTDGGGSIRIPAAWCGLYGYKASFGRVPSVVRPNAFGSTMPFLFEGPLTRTVEDAALVLDVLSGYHPGDVFSIDGQPHEFTRDVRRDISGMRIAYTPDFGVFPVDRRIRETVGQAVQAFRDAGAVVEEIDLTLPYGQRELSDLWCRQIMLVNVGAFENMKKNGLDLLGEHRDDFPDGYLRWADHVYGMTISELDQDYVMRSAVYDTVQAVYADFDLLVTPTLSAMPVLNSEVPGTTVGPSEVEGVEVDPYIGWCPTYLTNFTGHPAASIPAGLVDGLPVGMQIQGRRYADSDVLAASGTFESLRPWADSYHAPRDRALGPSA
ncbi:MULTISPECIES: amidase [unclassified Blastococcus]